MSYQPRGPFPSALKVKPTNKKNLAQNEELMKLFKQVHISIPLLHAIKHVPTYAKFLKELCTQRREAQATPQRIMLSEDVSAVLLDYLPQKLKD